MKLTRLERYMISNQLRMLEALYPDEAQDLSEHRDAIESGYELHYEEAMQHIYENTLTSEQCSEVIDILNMHRQMLWSYGKLEDKTGIPESSIKFPGFSGNEETSQMAYTRYFCANGRFDELDRGDDFNSHIAFLDRYRAMLTEWRKSDNVNNLNKEDLQRIIAVPY